MHSCKRPADYVVPAMSHLLAVGATASLTQFTQRTADSRRSVRGYLPLPRLQLAWRVVTRHPGDTSQILENCG